MVYCISVVLCKGVKMKILFTIIYFILIGQGCFYFGLALPRDKFYENKFPYKSFAWEKNGKIYDNLHIKKWKSRVPDMSMLTHLIFPKRVQANITAQKLDRLVKESCVAEIIHYILCVFSIGFYHIWKGKTGTIISVLYFLGNIPYILIQRYNRPHFISLRDKMILREERHINANG